MTALRLITATGATPPSLARVEDPMRAPLRVGLVQHRWHAEAEHHAEALAEGVRMAAQEGARLVCLQELTLSPYFAIQPDGPQAVGAEPEGIPDGPTCRFAAALARETGVFVHASLYERVDGPDGLGFNTAVVFGPDGGLVSRTRKLHIPVTEGYYEDRYFRQGPADEADGGGFPVVGIGDARVGFPTCWDQWFPELARAYSLAGAEVLVYPTAIGSEPGHPAFDTQPLWQQVIVGNGIANGTFMVAVNRIGTETMAPPGRAGAETGPPTSITFYGSSFISDPYGRILVQAPRAEPAVLVADLDLDARADWLTLFPFLTTRRPDAYARLADAAATPTGPVPSG